MTVHEGGCLCGRMRYATLADPLRVTICHCRFCQHATGAAYMVEPIFRLEDFRVTQGAPTTFQVRSAGSGKLVTMHFCPVCGTKLYLTFERFTETCGVYAGTFDDPGWFSIRPDNARHIFTAAARHDTILPPGIPTFGAHALRTDGTPLESEVFDQPRPAGRRAPPSG